MRSKRSRRHRNFKQVRPPVGKVVKILRRFLSILSTVAVVAALLLAVGVFLAPCYGINMHPILSGSMEPELKVGGMAITKLIDVDQVKEGDIISFKINNLRITHRVIEVSKSGGKPVFRTKGDANEEPDPYAIIPKTDKVPKVIAHIPYFGYISGFMKVRSHFLVVVGGLSALLIAMYVWDLWRELRRMRREPVDWKSKV